MFMCFIIVNFVCGSFTDDFGTTLLKNKVSLRLGDDFTSDFFDRIFDPIGEIDMDRVLDSLNEEHAELTRDLIDKISSTDEIVSCVDIFKFLTIAKIAIESKTPRTTFSISANDRDIVSNLNVILKKIAESDESQLVRSKYLAQVLSAMSVPNTANIKQEIRRIANLSIFDQDINSNTNRLSRYAILKIDLGTHV